MEAALPQMFEEAATIAPMIIDAEQATTSRVAHATGPAASAVSASASMPAPLAGAPEGSGPLGVGFLNKEAEPSLGAPSCCPPLPPPPSQPPLAKKFARPRG